MPRKATGQVIEPSDGRSWAIRFRAYGKRRYVSLGTAEEGWNGPVPSFLGNGFGA